MPVQWTISHHKKLVVAVAKGEVRPRAMVDFLGALDAAGARPYAKLMFLERLVTTFSEDSVVALANLVRQREQESEVGPIAIIAQDDATFEQACQFAHVAKLVRPIRVFREWHEGRRQIDAIATHRANAAE